jgi:PIN like domain
MRFFFDRNMPPQLARMVNAFEREHRAQSYYDDDRFGDRTPDVEWIKVLAVDDPPWIIISGDGRILRNKTELSALREARLTFFCLSRTWMHMKIHEQAWKFIKVWPEIVENAKGTTPRIFEISGGAGLKVERLIIS